MVMMTPLQRAELVSLANDALYTEVRVIAWVKAPRSEQYTTRDVRGTLMTANLMPVATLGYDLAPELRAMFVRTEGGQDVSIPFESITRFAPIRPRYTGRVFRREKQEIHG